MFGNYLEKFPINLEIDRTDPKWIELTDKLNEIELYFKGKIEELDTLLDFERCDNKFLIRLGKVLGAGILNTDSDLVKRTKIRYAILNRRYAATFTKDIKIIIDTIAGGDSYIYSNGHDNFGKWLLITKPFPPEFDLSYNSCFGHPLYEPKLGMIFNAGSSGFPFTFQVIMIDVDNDSLTTEQINQLEFELLKKIPAHFIVYFGYVSGTDFIPYKILGRP